MLFQRIASGIYLLRLGVGFYIGFWYYSGMVLLLVFCYYLSLSRYIYIYIYTGHTQKNGGILKVNENIFLRAYTKEWCNFES
jgi:hypothetical protein